jgi:nitrogen fixation protein NifX
MSTKSNSGAPISKDVALRIALAARALPDTEPVRVLKVLEDAIGLPPTPTKLSSLTVKTFKSAADGEFSSIDTDAIKEALAFLKGDKGIDEKDDAPTIESYKEGDIPDSIRVAIASNKGEELDGHFGSCSRFLIYQVSATEMRLIDSRGANGPEARDDKNAFRASLINDCQVLFVISIGGPAAAKVVRAGVHPIKYPAGGNARERIEALQKVIIDSPPPWLAKAMGHDDESRVRFERTETEYSASGA